MLIASVVVCPRQVAQQFTVPPLGCSDRDSAAKCVAPRCLAGQAGGQFSSGYSSHCRNKPAALPAYFPTIASKGAAPQALYAAAAWLRRQLLVIPGQRVGCVDVDAHAVEGRRHTTPELAL